jgi:hypothetical protein
MGVELSVPEMPGRFSLSAAEVKRSSWTGPNSQSLLNLFIYRQVSSRFNSYRNAVGNHDAIRDTCVFLAPDAQGEIPVIDKCYRRVAFEVLMEDAPPFTSRISRLALSPFNTEDLERGIRSCLHFDATIALMAWLYREVHARVIESERGSVTRSKQKKQVTDRTITCIFMAHR